MGVSARVLWNHAFSQYFRTTLQLHNSARDCARKLSKPSTDSAYRLVFSFAMITTSFCIGPVSQSDTDGYWILNFWNFRIRIGYGYAKFVRYGSGVEKSTSTHLWCLLHGLHITTMVYSTPALFNLFVIVEPWYTLAFVMEPRLTKN